MSDYMAAFDAFAGRKVTGKWVLEVQGGRA